VSVAILDIDGTLVDTNYQHTLAWYRAFKSHDIVVPIWRIHRHIGMGGDQLVEALTDERTEREHGDRIREAERSNYMEMIDEVSPMEGARRLMEDLGERGHTVVLASSAHDDEVERYLDLLDARDLADSWTSSGDVEATKPEPDLVQVALKRAEASPQDAVMIGDSPWDARAAGRAKVRTLAVMTGGFSEEELQEAGAETVYESVEDLRQALDKTPLR
jgi:HAD superfamily hydrolase (TIGR01509 family)